MNLLTPKLINSKTYKLANLQPHKLKPSPTYSLINSKLINSPTYSLINSKLINSPTYTLTSLKSYNKFYKIGAVRHTILARKRFKSKQKSVVFSLNRFFFCPFFGHIICILHHFAFLVWLPACVFSTPKSCI